MSQIVNVSVVKSAVIIMIETVNTRTLTQVENMLNLTVGTKFTKAGKPVISTRNPRLLLNISIFCSEKEIVFFFLPLDTAEGLRIQHQIESRA